MSECSRCGGVCYVWELGVHDGCTCRIPEHDLGWFGKRVDEMRCWEIYVEDFIVHWRRASNTIIKMSRRYWECPDCQLDSQVCRCLEGIRWFKDDRDERVVDPHGVFWR